MGRGEEVIKYNHAPIDSDYVVEPGLNGQLEVGVAQHLEPEPAMVLSGCWRGVAV